MTLSIAPVYLLLITELLSPAKTNKAIQFDISNILNSRPVTVLDNNKLVTWKKGIDGNGDGDGYLTLSAALFNGDKEPNALPDDPVFTATAAYPEIDLHYSNTDSLASQACSMAGVSSAGFNTPIARYKSVYLALTSSAGPSALAVTFNYTDGSETKDYTVPDYYDDIASSNSTLCYLAHNLAKWGNKNQMTEKDHHNIDLLKISPNPVRKLQSINISKGKAGYLLLWAAVGE